MNRTWRTVLLLALGLAVFSGAMCAEEIQLKDGTKVTGKVIGVNGDTFQIKTNYGEIQVPRSQILSITFTENQPAKEGGSAVTDVPAIDESLQGTAYVNRTGHFQVTVPKGWALAPELRAQSKDIVAALKSPDESKFFLVTPEKFEGTLATYKVLVETQSQAKFKDYEKLSESDVELDGRKGIKLVWHGKNTAANDAPLKAEVFIIPYDGRVVRLSFLTLEPLFDEALPSFESIAASYHAIAP